jgi:hypothetical protein
VKTGAIIAAAALATAIAVSGWTAYIVRPAHVRTVIHTHVVTVTRTAPPKVITKLKIRTRRVSSPPAMACQDIGGSPEPGVAVQGLPGDTRCTLTLLSPMGASHLAQIEITTPTGDSSIWNLAPNS